MDSMLWHSQLHTRNQVPPDPVQLATHSAMSVADLHAYHGRMAGWLRGIRFSAPGDEARDRALSGLVRRNMATPPGAKPMAIVTGPNTLGKSTWIRSWALEQYRELIGPRPAAEEDLPVRPLPGGGEADWTPVVWINLPAAAGVKAFDGSFLSFLRYPTEGTRLAMTNRLGRAIDTHGIRIVVIDDVHLMRTSIRLGRMVLDHLKNLNTVLGEHGATMVLVGANLEGSDLVADPQISGRLKLITMAPFASSTTSEQQDWQQLLTNIEHTLIPCFPRAASGMLARDLPGLIWRRTQGYLGDIALLISEAALEAVSEGAERITAEHVQAVELSERAGSEEARLNSGRRPRMKRQVS